MIEITPYSDALKERWDRLVRLSRNGTFLHYRSYMDYHCDRFADASVIVSYKGKDIALFPANYHDYTVFSHEGLTYGGLLSTEAVTTNKALAIFSAIIDYYRRKGYKKINYKCVPWIYHRLPAEEELYALYRHDARLVSRDPSTTIDLTHPLRWRKGRIARVNEAMKAMVVVEETDDATGFWHVLEENLRVTYGATPVHSLDEIMMLKRLFPKSVRFIIASIGGTVVGGTVLYLTANVVHTQYISANVVGKNCGAIDAVFHYVLKDMQLTQHYLDFGKSSEQLGRVLNQGLIRQKEGFGGRCICYDTYEMNL